MSKYTMELRELFTPIKFNPPLYSKEQVEGFFKDYELSDFLTSEQIEVIEDAGIWNKDKLAKMIVNHYYMREIGQETIGLFKHTVKYSMEELMEEYLPLIYSSSIQYNPLVNVDFTETFTKTANIDNSSSSTGESNVTNTGSSSSNSYSSGDSIGINSDTPQGRITKQNILAGNYATATAGTETSSEIHDGTSTNSNSSTNSNTNSTSGTESEEEYTKRVVGNSGVSATNQKMIEQYRNNIRAINREIIEKLEPCFMGLY